MSGFEVNNMYGGTILSDTFKHYGLILQQPITTITDAAVGKGTSSSGIVMAAPFTQATSIGYPDIRNTLPTGTMSLFNPVDGGEFCGKYWYAPNAGTIYHLGQEYPKQSGYLDVFDGSGNLIWSALSAKNVPRITGIFQVTAQQLLDGISLNVGSNPYILMNTLPSLFAPGPQGTGVRGGVFGRYSNNTLQLWFGCWGRGGAYRNRIIEFLNGGTLSVYIFSFAG